MKYRNELLDVFQKGNYTEEVLFKKVEGVLGFFNDDSDIIEFFHPSEGGDSLFHTLINLFTEDNQSQVLLALQLLLQKAVSLQDSGKINKILFHENHDEEVFFCCNRTFSKKMLEIIFKELKNFQQAFLLYQNAKGQNVLDLVVCSGNAALIRYVLDQAHDPQNSCLSRLLLGISDDEVVYRRNIPILFYPVMNGDGEILTLLLEHAALADKITESCSTTALLMIQKNKYGQNVLQFSIQELHEIYYCDHNPYKPKDHNQKKLNVGKKILNPNEKLGISEEFAQMTYEALLIMKYGKIIEYNNKNGLQNGEFLVLKDENHCLHNKLLDSIRELDQKTIERLFHGSLNATMNEQHEKKDIEDEQTKTVFHLAEEKHYLQSLADQIFKIPILFRKVLRSLLSIDDQGKSEWIQKMFDGEKSASGYGSLFRRYMQTRGSWYPLE